MPAEHGAVTLASSGEVDPRERVEAAVQLQLNSPDFPHFCVVHAADPAYTFLFLDDGSAARRLYIRLLEAQRGVNSADVTVTTDDTSAAQVPATPPLRLFTPVRKRFRADRFSTRERLQLSPWDVDQLEMLFASWARSAAPHGVLAHTTPLPFMSPHRPQLFPSRASLRAFVQQTAKTAEGRAPATVDDLAAQAMKALPRTECHVAVFVHVAERMLSFDTVWRRAALSASLHDSSQVEPETHSALPPVSLYLEAALTLAQCLATLWSQQRRRETDLWELAVAPSSPSSSLHLHTADAPCGGHRRFYYQDVFEAYATRLLVSFSEWAARWRQCLRTYNDGNGSCAHAALSSSVAAASRRVTELARCWCEEKCFRPATTARLASLVDTLGQPTLEPAASAPS